MRPAQNAMPCGIGNLPSMRSAPEGGCDNEIARSAQQAAEPSMRSAPEGGCDNEIARSAQQAAEPSMRSAQEGGCDGAGLFCRSCLGAFNAVRPGGRMRQPAGGVERATGHPSMRSAPEG